MSGDGNINCIKKLTASADNIVESGLGISGRSFEERVKFWYEIKDNYSNYEKGSCGSFNRSLDSHFRSRFETALLTLAVTFFRNQEDFDDAGVFSEDELLLYELIERYRVLPSKKEMKSILFSEDKGGPEFLSFHYNYIEKLVNDACSDSRAINPFLLHHVRKTWDKYDRTLQDIVINAIEKNGLRWFIAYIGDGSRRAEQIIYNISGGFVNLGNGVRLIDSILNSPGINAGNCGDFEGLEKGRCLPEITKVEGSIAQRSGMGGSPEEKGPDKSIRFCAFCGTRLTESSLFCSGCGKRI